jgi:hypothetical protein
MKIEASKVGAAINLYISAFQPEEITIIVNQMFNLGIVSKIPDDYREDIDCSIVLQSDRKRFLKGIIALCTIQLQNQADKIGRYNERALIMAANFIRQNICFTKSYYKNGNDYSETIKPFQIGNMDYCNATDSPHA